MNTDGSAALSPAFQQSIKEPINMYKQRLNIHFFALLVLTSVLSSCGGGGSNSGASIAAPVAMTSTIPAGVYSGPEIRVFISPEVDDTPIEGTLSITVTGQFAGQQQVVVAFSQFSGSSAIVPPNNSFSISSGKFLVDTGAFGRCEVEATFAGNFTGPSVTGTTDGVWICAEASVPIIEEGTWTLTHTGSAKQSFRDDSEPVRRN